MRKQKIHWRVFDSRYGITGIGMVFLIFGIDDGNIKSSRQSKCESLVLSENGFLQSCINAFSCKGNIPPESDQTIRINL